MLSSNSPALYVPGCKMPCKSFSLQRLSLLFSVIPNIFPALFYSIQDCLYIQTSFHPLTVHSSVFNKVIRYCQRKHSNFRMTGLHISRYMFSESTAFYILLHSDQKTVVL